MKNLLFTISFICSVCATAAQTTDSAHRSLRVDINDRSWCVLVNTGFQKRFYFGAGMARTHFLGSPHGVYGYDVYTGVNFFPAFKSAQAVTTGIRLGANFFGNGFFMGAEMQYLQAKGINDFLFTPKAGIGFSMLYLAYGYSISSNKFPITGISQNSLSLQVNWPFYIKNVLTNKGRWGAGVKQKK